MKKLIALFAIVVLCSVYSFASSTNVASVNVSVVHSTPTVAVGAYTATDIVLHPGSKNILLPSVPCTVSNLDPGCIATVDPHSGWFSTNPLVGVSVDNTSIVIQTGVMDQVGFTFTGATLTAASDGTAVAQGNVAYSLTLTVSSN